MRRDEILGGSGGFMGLPKVLAEIPNSILPASAKLVWAVVVERFGENNDYSFPGFGTIAADTGLSRRQVSDVVSRLKKLKLLDVTVNGHRPKKGLASNLYRCNDLTSAISALVRDVQGTSAETALPPVRRLHPKERIEGTKRKNEGVAAPPQPAGAGCVSLVADGTASPSLPTATSKVIPMESGESVPPATLGFSPTAPSLTSLAPVSITYASAGDDDLLAAAEWMDEGSADEDECDGYPDCLPASYDEPEIVAAPSPAASDPVAAVAWIAPAPGAKVKKAGRLTDTVRRLVCADLTCLLVYMTRGGWALQNPATMAEAGYTSSCWFKASGDAATPDPDLTPAQRAGYYWFRLQEARVNRNMRVEFPPFGELEKLVGVYKGLTAPQFVAAVDTLFDDFDGVRAEIGEPMNQGVTLTARVFVHKSVQQFLARRRDQQFAA